MTPTKLMYRMAEAAEALGMGRSKLYEEAAAGRLETVKVGKNRLVPAAALDAYVDRLRCEQGRAAGSRAV